MDFRSLGSIPASSRKTRAVSSSASLGTKQKSGKHSTAQHRRNGWVGDEKMRGVEMDDNSGMSG